MVTEMRYTVKQLAKLAGVSARTLHYYDEIGLLSPDRNPDNGYRLYEHEALLRLQQILFLRELDLSLDEILVVLDQPGFDLLHALEKHRRALLARQERLAALVQTVDRTINHLKGSTIMDDKQLFEGFSEEQQAEYAKEAERRWGSQNVKELQKRWASYSPEKKKAVLEEGKAIYLDLIASMPLGPASPQSQACVARWHQNLRNFYEPTVEILLGLGDLYNDDPDFNATFVRMHPDLAPYMREAIQVYCKTL